MRFTFREMTEADARAIQSWQYTGLYGVYNGDPDDARAIAEMLDARSPHFSVWSQRDELVGVFVYGSAAGIEETDLPSLFHGEGAITIGLGLRPDLTGKGGGAAFVSAGLAFARERFGATAFRLFVLMFNQRAITVYERAGFQRTAVRAIENRHGALEFLEMTRSA